MGAPEFVQESPGVTVFSGGSLSTVRAEQIARAIRCILDRRAIIWSARVRVKTGLCGRGPMVVQVNTRVGDLPARMVAVTSGVDDLVPALARLDRQLARLCAPWRPRPWPDETRRLMTVGPNAVVARRKSVVLQRMDPMDAVRVMDAMDYDVNLFTDAETGEDAVVYRAGPSGLRLARQQHVRPPGWVWSPGSSGPPVPLIVNPRAAPVLSKDVAVHRAGEHGVRHLFYTDEATGRGQLLYPRYDGNLGLITPSHQ
ncbi:sigma 54 modulation/S30EA ribosomal C-terminal domain-containing protein [Mycobacterium vicinigordonae]|uniref:Sigma 54 modulation/S30EA ribosomal C-terminal domain-containing protein n=1 Tax=Mycobacterium vicinigordonae TaxID=1719132 RepID=A0A7D6HW48_9MYCO|nr:sigma 54 modulation/S30EA ribosomal C-terminal domain-containing protein [Mycobacterium vicinigordonae]QLL05835.1 sigma 54 modulation/S30EA ribosomal C-terminal domain-containing protein [Mycobacterium vicinigordonae]